MSAAAAVVLSLPFVADAHDLARSESRLEVRGSVIEGWHLFDLLEFGGVDTNGDGSISYDELDAAIPAVYNAIKEHLIVRGPEAPIRTEVRKYSVQDGHVLRLDMAYIFASPVTSPAVMSTLSLVTRPEHLHFVSLNIGGEIQQAVLDARQSTATFSIAGPSRRRTTRRFLALGVEHILTGYDHLAFLLSLVIATTAARSLIGIVTSFTIAHSLTLALATFGLVALPSRVVESAIALSIAYVAFENLLLVQIMKRYRITFVFGLLHGFGFSNVLRDMQLPRSELALSLFTFNAGVEVGQVLFVLTMYPLVTSMTASRWPSVRPAVSAAVLCVGVYWFVRRAFLG
jgi:hydrogenase/urease accessory protein HupE